MQILPQRVTVMVRRGSVIVREALRRDLQRVVVR